MYDPQLVLKNSGKPTIGTKCFGCKGVCEDEHGVYAYAGQISPKAFCSRCKVAALDYAIMERHKWVKSYSQTGMGFDISNWARKRSGGRTKRHRGRNKKPSISMLDKLLASGVVVDEV